MLLTVFELIAHEYFDITSFLQSLTHSSRHRKYASADVPHRKTFCVKIYRL